MFDWLFDGVWVVTLALGAVGVACSVGWWRTRNKYYAIGVGIVVLLFGIYIVLHFLVETASEQMKSRVEEIANSVHNKQIRTVLEKNLADDFRVGSYDKKGFIEKAESLRTQFNVESITVWDVKLVDIDREKRTATVSFKAKPLTPSKDEAQFYLVKAVFVMSPKENWWQKEEWKMRSFEYFNPFVDTNQPLPIP